MSFFIIEYHWVKRYRDIGLKHDIEDIRLIHDIVIYYVINMELEPYTNFFNFNFEMSYNVVDWFLSWLSVVNSITIVNPIELVKLCSVK